VLQDWIRLEIVAYGLQSVPNAGTGCPISQSCVRGKSRNVPLSSKVSEMLVLLTSMLHRGILPESPLTSSTDYLRLCKSYRPGKVLLDPTGAAIRVGPTTSEVRII